MTDYDKSTGTTGTMRIRVLSSTVEFWINSGNSTTWIAALPWGYKVNGVTKTDRTYNYQAGSGWEKLATFTVTDSQTVQFYLYSTGTSGFGGPTTHSVYVDRVSVPAAPQLDITNHANTWISVDADNVDNGGASILETQIGWGTSSTTRQNFDTANSNGYLLVGGLTPDTTYYFWARMRNSKGWSAWSARKSQRTDDVPDPPTAPVVTEVKQESFKADSSYVGNNGSSILESRFGYGTNSSAPTAYTTTNSITNQVISGLPAGETIYIWAQQRNEYGWSPLSARTTVTLVAGAWVDVNGVKKRAVPYVKYNGVWYVAEPYAKIAGLWKGTS